MEEKRNAFEEKAKKNMENRKIHDSLIATHLVHENQSGLRSSAENYAQHGNPSGSLYLALMEYAEKYADQETATLKAENERLREENGG